MGLGRKDGEAGRWDGELEDAYVQQVIWSGLKKKDGRGRGGKRDSDQRPLPRTFAPISVSTAHVLIALWLQNCCRGNRMEMGIIMYSRYRRPGGCGAGSRGTALYPEPDVSGQNHSTQDSSRILRSSGRREGGRREGKMEGREMADGPKHSCSRILEADNGGRAAADLPGREGGKGRVTSKPK